MKIKQIDKSTSSIIDFFRGFSAQIVVIGHLISFYGVQAKYHIPIIQNFGVLVFLYYLDFS
jgi:hypothetical protein